MQDKTDSVDVVVDVNGQPFDDYRDVGNKLVSVRVLNHTTFIFQSNV